MKTERAEAMTDKNTKMILTSNGEEIELPLYNENDLSVVSLTLDDYCDFVMEIGGKKFNVKILKSDFEKIKNIFR